MAAGVEAHDPGHEQSSTRAAAKKRRVVTRALATASPARISRVRRRAAGARRGRGRVARRRRSRPTSPVMAASPRPMTVCQPSMRRPPSRRSTGVVPPIAKSTAKTNAATGTVTRAATAAAGADERPRGQHAPQHDETSQPTRPRYQAHQGDVGAERGDAAVGHQQRLDQQHDREAQHRGPRADQHRCERATEEVAAGAGPDGEVDHLGGEDEGGDQPGHGRRAVVELAARPAQRHRDPAAATTPVATEVGASRKPSGTCMAAPGGSAAWMLLAGRISRFPPDHRHPIANYSQQPTGMSR